MKQGSLAALEINYKAQTKASDQRFFFVGLGFRVFAYS